jgi:adenine deaminase
MSDLQRRLAVARGDEPADLVVRGGKVLSVFTREWLDVDVAIVDGTIAGLGEYEGKETIDATGRFVVPGFVDAHMHIESVKLLVDELARLVLPLGTTAVVADPHEIANVLGTDGLGGAPARRLLHGVVVRPGLAVRVAAASARTRRSRGAHASEPRARARRDDELPGRDRG